MINKVPLVSVIIPTYNRAAMLDSCLASVVRQTFTRWEVVVVDNCSTDKTDEVVTGFKDDRIKLLKINNEGVIGKSRNLGVTQSKGEWIAFLDSDDKWASDKLANCLEAVDHDTDFIYHDFVLENTSGSIKKGLIKSWQVKSPVLRHLLVKGNPIVNSSVMVRRSVLKKIGKINEQPVINPAVDFHTWLAIARITDKFLYLPAAMGTYVVHGNNVTSRDVSQAYISAIAEFLDVLDKNDRERVDSQVHYMRGRYLFRIRDYAKSAPELKKCLLMPGFLRRIKALAMLLRIAISC